MSGWEFNNAAAYMRSSTGFLTAPPLTILCVFQTSSLAATQVPWIMTAAGSSAQNWRFQVNTDGTTTFTAAQSSSQPATTVNTVTVNVPQYLIGRTSSDIDRETILNGDLVNKGVNTTSRIPNGVNRTSFGMKDDTAASNPLVGVIHYAAMWAAKLDDAEVKALAAGALPTRVRPASLWNYWPSFGRNDGTTVNDIKGRSPLTISLGQVSTLAARRRSRSAGGVAA